MLHTGPLQHSHLLHMILVVDLSLDGPLEKPDWPFWSLSYMWSLLSGPAGSSVCVLRSSKQEFWQKPNCGWSFWSRKQPSRKNLLFSLRFCLSQVILGLGLLASVSATHIQPCCLLVTLRLDRSPTVLYPALMVLYIKIFLQTHLLSWSFLQQPRHS